MINVHLLRYVRDHAIFITGWDQCQTRWDTNIFKTIEYGTMVFCVDNFDGTSIFLWQNAEIFPIGMTNDLQEIKQDIQQYVFLAMRFCLCNFHIFVMISNSNHIAWTLTAGRISKTDRGCLLLGNSRLGFIWGSITVPNVTPCEYKKAKLTWCQT